MDCTEFPGVEGNVPLLESREKMHYSNPSGAENDIQGVDALDALACRTWCRFRENRGIE